MNKDDDVSDIYEEISEVVAALIEDESVDILAVAAVLLSQSLTIYKTALSPEDFDNMIVYISNLKDKVKSLHAEDDDTDTETSGTIH